MKCEKMRWVRRDVCVWWGRTKKKGNGYMGGGGKKKRNGEWGIRLYVHGVKKKGVVKKEEKNLKGKKLNWFYLYVHFVWCRV